MSSAIKTNTQIGSLTRQWIRVPSAVGIFYALSLSFLVGVFLYTYVPLGLSVPAGLLVGAFVSLLVLIVGKRIEAVVVLCLCVACMLGCVRMLLLPDIEQPFLPFNERMVVVEGVVIADVDKRDAAAHLTLEVSSINHQEVKGVVQVTTDRTTPILYGDVLSLQGTLEIPKPFKTESGREFDYKAYLRTKGVGAVMVYPHITVTAPHGVTFFGSLYMLKHKLEHAIEGVVPEPAAGLLEGILLGNKAALGDALYALFIIAGLVHVVVLSGYNLTIVAEALMRLCSKLPEKISFAIGSSGIILFALMVGGEAVVIRASIMALIVIAGRAFKRPTIALRSLVFACVVMVLHNPLILTNDPSFILSFLAAFGLITFSQTFERWLSFVTPRGGVRGVLAATLATQAFVFPALIFYTGKLSLISLPANVLALPLIPPAMFFGFLTGALALIHPWLALPLMIPAWGLLSLIIGIAKVAASIPFAAVTLPALQTPYLFLIYIVLVPLAVYAYRVSLKTPA